MQVIDFTSADRIMSEGHTSKGDQPKWKQSGNWYKADHMGYEALSEIIVSRLLTWSMRMISWFINQCSFTITIK